MSEKSKTWWYLWFLHQTLWCKFSDRYWNDDKLETIKSVYVKIILRIARLLRCNFLTPCTNSYIKRQKNPADSAANAPQVFSAVYKLAHFRGLRRMRLLRHNFLTPCTNSYTRIKVASKSPLCADLYWFKKFNHITCRVKYVPKIKLVVIIGNLRGGRGVN